MERLTNRTDCESLKISRLRKQFSGGFTAVDDLSLTIYQDEILVLLGHNGAGKTTTINMLHGELKPTSGSANAFGVDMINDRLAARFVGICPQENVLFTKMTVHDNMTFFCEFRGVENVEATVEKSLKQFSLQHKANSLVANISGG
jgi:ATP-binding cassette, subfamily A (ABC1), member 3